MEAVGIVVASLVKIVAAMSKIFETVSSAIEGVG